MIQDIHPTCNIRMWSMNYSKNLFFIEFNCRSTSRIWSFLFKVALIVTIFFIVKSFIAGGNRTGAGGVRPMGTGPDHRPPGSVKALLLFSRTIWIYRWWWRRWLVFKLFSRRCWWFWPFWGFRWCTRSWWYSTQTTTTRLSNGWCIRWCQ